MTNPNSKTLREKMIQILTDKPQNIAIVQLFELEAQSDDQNKIMIRQTILLVLENHHEWTKISKCLKFWNGLDKYIRTFYKRMKDRINEQCNMNLSTQDMISQFQRMFDKHKSVVKNKAQPLDVNLDKFLSKDYKKANAPQSKITIDEKNQELKKDVPVMKKDFPNKLPQPIQKVQNSQKSNSLSSRDSNINNVRVIQKKPTFGMLRRQESSNSNSSNLVSKRNTSRRTFGQGNGNQLRSVQINKIENQNQNVEAKQDSKNTKIQAPKQIAQKTKQPIKSFIEPQKQQKQETKNKPDQPRKLNIFQRKQKTVNNRPNPLLATQKKESNQNTNPQQQQVKSKQKKLESSLSKSVTPQKPLVHRKKIILKKPSDFQKNFFDSDDEFSSFKKLQSYEKSSEFNFYSQEKDSFPLINSQEEELRMEIQNQFSHQSVNLSSEELKNPQVQININEKLKTHVLNDEKGHHQQQKERFVQSKTTQSKPKPQAFKQSSIQISMVRQPEQLFSDYEVSLMGFNPRGLQSGVDYYKLADKCKAWTWKTESSKWDEKILNLKNRNTKIQIQ